MKMILLLLCVWRVTPDKDVMRHISETAGPRYHQTCTNHGNGDEPDHDGFRRCVDTFTNKRTGGVCKVNPDNQQQFVCSTELPPNTVDCDNFDTTHECTIEDDEVPVGPEGKK